MSKIVKILLAVALLVFVVGMIWSFVVLNHKKEDTTNKPTPTPDTTITTSVTTKPAAPAPPAPAQGVVSKPAPAKKAVVRQRLVTQTIIFDETVSASAWASAGVNPDGSTFAEAHAN